MDVLWACHFLIKLVEVTLAGPSGKSFVDAAKVAKPVPTRSVAVHIDVTWTNQFQTVAFLNITKTVSSTQITTVLPKRATI